VRLLWSSDTFAEEPVPPDALSTVPFDGGSLMLSAAKGEELIRGRHCARCHADLETESTSAARGIPSLEGMGDRLNSDWIRAWVLAPRSLRPDATMPSMLTGLNDEARQQAAADLAAYLMTLHDTASEGSAAPSLDEETVERGGALYEDLGCIACHRLTAPGDDDQWNRIPLSQIAAKFTGGRLVDYLQAPGRHLSTTFMPDFRLTDEEAAAIAGFLIDQSKTPLAGVVETVHGDAARGETLFRSVGCNQCHLKAAGESLPAPFVAGPLDLEDLNGRKGCLANPDSESPVEAATPTMRPVPEFAFRDFDRFTLWAFGKTRSVGAEAKLPHPARESSRLMAALRCSACHDRDGQRSPRMEIIADEGGRGLSPEQFPALTWTGDRLRKDWTERFIAGEIKEKPRQWLKARMPSFPAYAKTLAVGLAAEHGHAGDDPERLGKPDLELAEAGRLLIQGTGLDCRQCHGLGDEPPTGDRRTLLAPGINFAMVKDRMRSDFYHRWMLDPPRFDLNTRMPKLAADGKTTKVTRFFDGDARKQFDAIWAFLQQPDDSPPPQSN